MVIRNRKSGALAGLSCSAAGVNPEVVMRASDEHYFVRNAGFSGSQNVRANPGAFDTRNGMFDNDSFARKALEWFFFNEGLSLDYDLYWMSPKLGVTPMQLSLR